MMVRHEHDNAIDWQACREISGDVLRPGVGDSPSDRMFVLARTYTLPAAAARLGLPASAVAQAVKDSVLDAFTDPVGKLRIPAAAVEAAIQAPERWERLAGSMPLKVQQIAQVAKLAPSAVRRRLKKAGLSRTRPLWREIRGKWGLPQDWRRFEALSRKRSSAGRQAELRQKLLEAFPTWENDMRPVQRAILHIGPTNSGKTFQALNELVEAGSGWYLSPLRLLAHEVFDTLNRRGVRCSLLTGEESIPVEGAAITAATIEMFNPGRSGECIIVDEAHMLTDPQRGWAWTRAIMEARAPILHIAGAPFIEDLVLRLLEAAGIRVDTLEHARLTPLQVIGTPWALTELPPRTILVAFSRAMVLGLKTELERHHRRNVSVVYGNLPPEVRLNQAERFARGESEICVATDAVGMGLNLPADNVCFFETAKFDGRSWRTLTANEIRQIGGRAGRYGLSDLGRVGALRRDDLAIVRQAMEEPISEYGFAYVAPTPEALRLIPGTLAARLQAWMLQQGIPARWKRILRPVDLSQQIELAGLLTPQEVERLGDEAALQLVNAPTYHETRDYWLLCARAIIHGRRLPEPPPPQATVIRNADELLLFEQAIRAADCYLWLSQRHEFHTHAPAAESVRSSRAHWSAEVDGALERRVDTARRCRVCGRPLPLKHRYNICDRCYSERPGWERDYW